jgi:hypothetical protein
MRRETPNSSLSAYYFTTSQTSRPVTPSPRHLPARQTHRNNLPLLSLAACAQASTVVFTRSGSGRFEECGRPYLKVENGALQIP